MKIKVATKSDVKSRRKLYADTKKNFDAIRKIYDQGIKEYFYETIGNFFADYPWIENIHWVQGTPSFCDGGPCGLIITDPEINEYLSEEDEYGDPIRDESVKAPSKAIEKQAQTLLQEFMEAFTSQDMEQMFGESVKVIITPKGVKIEDYYMED